MTAGKPSAAIFVDVQNIYYTCKEVFGKSFNYRGLYGSLAERYRIVTANAYAIDSNNDGQHKFQTALRNIGFNVKLKPYLQRRDGSAKGDWDVGITIDVLDAARHVDHVFLMSGDGDFDLLLERINQEIGVCSHVISVEKLTALSLLKQCHTYHPIGERDLVR